MKYERLTKRLDNGLFELKDDSVLGIYQAELRLTELEDKIENGTLIELPCKVGDYAWFLVLMWDSEGFCGYIDKRKVNGFFINDGILQIEDDIVYDCFNLGGDVFLTKEEAEKELKEYQDGRKE